MYKPKEHLKLKPAKKETSSELLLIKISWQFANPEIQVNLPNWGYCISCSWRHAYLMLKMKILISVSCLLLSKKQTQMFLERTLVTPGAASSCSSWLQVILESILQVCRRSRHLFDFSRTFPYTRDF
jgi:hypothetical protein